MGRSSMEGKDVIFNWFKNKQDIDVIVDIGAGKGMYRKISSKQKILHKANWIAVEVWKPYIDEFQLDQRYDKIINQDARTIDYASLSPIDLTIMGDVLEHMTKEESIQLVDKVMAVSKYGVISIPIIHYPQGEENGNPFEEHIKDDWTFEEVINTFSKYVKSSHRGEEIGVFWLEK
jgi:hypothetical protein